jgi:energy-coupling factor transport system ATP-binding protein
MYKIGPFSFSHFQATSRKVFCNSSFSFPRKGVVLITGPSGSGKSTFLNLLKGIIPEYVSGKLEGEITYNNRTLAGENFKRNLKNIAYLFQNPKSQIIHHETAEEFFFTLENFNIEYDEAKNIRSNLSLKFDLNHLWDKKTLNLSHGECQKLLLASLLALSPQVLLLDEPTAFLDILERKKFYDLLDTLKEEHLVVIVDHHVSEVMPHVDTIVTIGTNGEVVLSNDKTIPEFDTLNSFELPSTNNSPNLSIQFDNVRFSYEKSHELIDISKLTLHSGDVVIIKGRNGTGKSTLMKLIAGFLPLEDGKINILSDDNILSKEEIFKQVGFISQDPESSFLYDTLAEELGVHNFGFSKNELERSPYLFSEGEKRRISIFIALAQNKNILLYDEPTFGQDKNNKKILAEIILNLKKSNKLQIIISHDEEFIAKVGDRTLSLKGQAYE